MASMAGGVVRAVEGLESKCEALRLSSKKKMEGNTSYLDEY
jgi:hypothetical protein